MSANKLFVAMDQPDRTKTQIAYAANYLPLKVIKATDERAEKLISWQRKVKLYKGQILAALNPEMTTITYAPHKQYVQEWQVHWEYNAIPTQEEWERKSTSFIISCDFRVIAGGTKIVILSFY